MLWSDNVVVTKLINDKKTELLTFYQTAEWNAVNGFGVQLSIMITIFMALIAASAAALCENNQILVLTNLLVPILVAILRRYAIETLDRYYARFLEAVAVQKKIRFHLGIGPSENPFKEERFEVLDRELGSASANWIRKKLEEGHNEVASRIFHTLCWAAAFLPIAAGTQLLTCSKDLFTMNGPLKILSIIMAVISSLVALRFVYASGTKKIAEKRNETYGVLADPKKSS